jgi:hypothetical protein
MTNDEMTFDERRLTFDERRLTSDVQEGFISSLAKGFVSSLVARHFVTRRSSLKKLVRAGGARVKGLFGARRAHDSPPRLP